jgi:hypothetical protein
MAASQAMRLAQLGRLTGRDVKKKLVGASWLDLYSADRLLARSNKHNLNLLCNHNLAKHCACPTAAHASLDANSDRVFPRHDPLLSFLAHQCQSRPERVHAQPDGTALAALHRRLALEVAELGVARGVRQLARCVIVVTIYLFVELNGQNGVGRGARTVDRYGAITRTDEGEHHYVGSHGSCMGIRDRDVEAERRALRRGHRGVQRGFGVGAEGEVSVAEPIPCEHHPHRR